MTAHMAGVADRRLAKQLRLGKVIYQLYYRPKSKIERCLREGPVNLTLTNFGRREMERRAHTLAPLRVKDSAAPVEIHFLSGRRFWYQTCFCAYSMMLHAGTEVRPVVYDDGTLGREYADKILRVLPSARVVRPEEIAERLDAHLPTSRYPTLRARRIVYPHLRKLTDVHAGLRGWKLVLDSDMLFFRRPDFLLAWLKSPQRPCYMLDVASAYGYSMALMSALAEAPIPDRLNVGVCGIRSEEIDWDLLEAWCRVMIEREGYSYYHEQALTAMLLARQACDIAPPEDYIIKPERADVLGRRGVLHHYVAESKSWYFRYGWKMSVANQ
jgi:hypothetical protein